MPAVNEALFANGRRYLDALERFATGDELAVFFTAVFLEYRDGRIAAQRNHDCFDAF